MQKPKEQQEAWAANQQQPMTNEGFVEVSYKVGDPDLETTSLSCQKMDWSQGLEIADQVERTAVSYGTLEPDRWRLDGSKRTLPEQEPYRYNGYVSQNICDNNGAFDDHPILTLYLNKTVDTLAGLTITWDEADGEYATAFDIRTYLAGVARNTISVTGNTETWSVVRFTMDENTADDFDCITIEVKKWSRPQRRARIGKIYLGIHKVYTKRELLGFSCSESIDPLSAELPKYELQFEVDNRDGAFSPTNPQGLTPYMMERQELQTRYGFRLDDGVEWIPGGVYYLAEWSAPENGLSASFKARDLLGFMDETYYKGVYHENGVTLYSLANAVLEEANLPKCADGSNRWVIDSSLQTMSTKAPLPVCSMAECLQLIANAAGCTIFFDRNGKLHIAPLPNAENSDSGLAITADNSYTRAEINLTKPIKRVDVNVYDYVKENESKELYSETLSIGTQNSTFLIAYSDTAFIDDSDTASKPALSVGTGVTVISKTFYANYCELVLRATTAGTYTVKVTGYPLKTTEKTYKVYGAGTGEVQTLKNQLITSSSRAQTVGEAVLKNATLRRRLSTEWRADPQMDVGDVITVEGNAMRVLSSSLSFSGAFKGKCEGVVINEH